MSVARTALVTGSASGIGRAVAERLIGDGWQVVGLDLVDSGPEGCRRMSGDAADPGVLRRALDAGGDRLDGLVCAAGVPPAGPWDDTAHWDETLRVDLSAAYHALRLGLPALATAHGSAVAIGSIVGPAEGSYSSPGYAAAKSGLDGLVRSMALIGAPYGVRVNLIEPGAIDTPFDPPIYPPNDRPDVPLGRMGTATEVAAAVCFLLGPEATYLTGSIIRIDGGRTIAPPLAATDAR